MAEGERCEETKMVVRRCGAEDRALASPANPSAAPHEGPRPLLQSDNGRLEKRVVGKTS